MKYTRKRRRKQTGLPARWWIGGWVGVSLVGQGLWGGMERGLGAGVLGPPPGVVLEVVGPLRRPRRQGRGRSWWQQADWRGGGIYLWRSGPAMLLRSGVLLLAWMGSGEHGSEWLLGAAGVEWLLGGIGHVWPRGRVWGPVLGAALYEGSLGGLVLGGADGVLWGVVGVRGGRGQGVFFRRTTPAQRRLLFAVWEQTGNVTQACRVAHVGRGTFYRWKPRFDMHREAGLEEFERPVPKRQSRIAPAVEEEVIAMREAHPEWGKQRIADEMAKENNWQRVVSPNTVRRILKEAGLWPEPTASPSRPKPAVRTAEEVGQTVNVDLCFVPAEHAGAAEVPAVSGSSGQLVVAPTQAEAAARTWPGQVFADPDLGYAEAMQAYVAAAQASAAAPVPKGPVEEAEAARKALRAVEQELRVERRKMREQRKMEDAAWRELRAERQQDQASYQALNRAERREQRTVQQAREELWRKQREHRRARVEQREAEDATWRQRRQELREGLGADPVVTSWLAILVVVDNCSRQCLGLPLFEVGVHVTAEEVMAELRELLPPALQFVITDRGTHFTGGALTQLAQDEEFVHVPIARHRPQSNGIAERFVQTLKDWLAEKDWHSGEECQRWLQRFREEYNERPHQGLEGLSPQEFARRQKLQETAVNPSVQHDAA